MKVNVIFAVRHNDPEELKKLMEKDNDVNFFVDDDNQTPLIIASKLGKLQIVNILIDNGADLEMCDIENKSPLYHASKEGHILVVQRLIEAGANVGAKRFEIPYFYHKVGDSDLVKQVKIALSNSPAFSNDRETCLHVAVRNKNVDMIKVLLDAGANPLAKTRDGVTPVDVLMGSKKHVINATIANLLLAAIRA